MGGNALPKGKCMYSHQAKHKYLCYNKHVTPPGLQIRPSLKPTAQLAYIVTDADCDYVSYTSYIVFFIMRLYSHLYGVCIKVFMAKNFVK